MTSELLARLKSPEDNLVERKPEGVNASEIRQSLVAFANSVPAGATAVLYLGVHDDGRIKGVESPDKLQKTVREQCERVCYPPIAFSTNVLEIEGKRVIAVLVPPSKNRPHFSGPAYVRRGAESVAASPELFNDLIASRNSKVAAILAMRSTAISVVCLQHKLGSTEQIGNSRYRTGSECVVLACDAHTVRLQVLGSDRNVTEPIENVTISRDEERHRPMLIVREATNQTTLVREEPQQSVGGTSSDRWELEATNYRLRKFETGALAYARKHRSPEEPEHYLCSTCFDRRRRSTLQPLRNGTFLKCLSCNSTIQTKPIENPRVRRLPRGRA